MVKWQAGIEYFNQAYDQDAVNTFSAVRAESAARVPGRRCTRRKRRSTATASACSARATVTFNDKADLTAGLRFDHEKSDAHLNTFFSPAIAPAERGRRRSDSFNDVSPQFAFGYRVNPQHTAYVSAARGYKAGGFNPAALPGSEAYGEEHAWHVEGGVKSTLAGGKVAANAAVFFIDWDDLQLNVPNPFVPGQFYIANVGGARSRGVEFDVTARPQPSLDVFAALGFTSATFAAGTMANGVAVDDNDLPYTPDYTATFGGQMTRADQLDGQRLRCAPKSSLTGAFSYDEANIGGPGRLFAREPARRRPRQALVRRRVAAQRVRHAATCRSRFPIRALRRRASSARMAGRARSASRSAQRSSRQSGESGRQAVREF